MTDVFSKSILLSSGVLEKENTYWTNILSEELPLVDPAFNNRKDTSTKDCAHLSFELQDDIAQGILNMAGQSDYGVFTILMSGVFYILHCYKSANDITIGVPVFRQKTDQELMTNVLPIRIRIKDQLNFKSFLQTVHKAIVDANEHMNYPYDKMMKFVDEQEDGKKKLFNMFVKYSNVHGTNTQHEPATDFSFSFDRSDRSLNCKFKFNDKLLESSTAQNCINNFINYFSVILSDSNILLSDIELLTDDDHKKIDEQFNQTDFAYASEKTIPELFEEQVAKTPDAIALSFEDEQITYKELNERSNQIARTLRKEGVKPDDIIGILVKRTPKMIIGILGILKSGGGYLPIDPDYPSERIEFVLEDSQAEILLTQEELIPKVTNKVKCLDIMDDSLFSTNTENLSPAATSNNIAYLIYTSGTTGRPKGAIIEHKAVHNLIVSICNQTNFREGKRILAITTMSFDIFVMETFLPLCKGLTAVLVDENDIYNPKMLRQVIKDKAIDILQFTPSRMNMLLEGSTKEDFGKVKTVFMGGEALPEQLLAEVNKKGNWKIYNLYGPTETTVYSTLRNVTGQTTVNIGKPIANTQIYILNKYNKLCAPGIVGELCLGGDGLGRGYHNRKELTAKSFMENTEFEGRRLYRSGDLARYLPDGNIQCLGRVDHQIKLRGYRIELGEIENHLLKINGIREAAATLKKDTFGEPQLCAYYASNIDFTVKDLRDALLGHMPEYMIPAFFIKLDKIPLTPNGKMDRKKLPDIKESNTIQSQFKTPTTDIEKIQLNVWQEIFGNEKISTNDNFFEIGGNSIKAVRAVAAYQKLGYSIQYNTLIAYPTIEKLSEYLLSVEEKTTNLIKNHTELEQLIKTKIGIDSKLVKCHVNDHVHNILYTKETEDEIKNKDLLNLVYQNSSKNMWPGYIICNYQKPEELASTQNLSGKEFIQLLSLKEEPVDNVIPSLIEYLDKTESEFVEDIIKQNVSNSFPCSPIQKATLHLNGHMMGFILQLDYLVEKEVIMNALNAVIAKHGILRSCLSPKDSSVVWKEHTTSDKVNIPYIDISQYDNKTKDGIIKSIVEQKFYKLYLEYNVIHYRFFLIKENLYSYKLIAPFDHILYDGMSSEIIIREIKEHISGKQTNSSPYTYKDYINQIIQGPSNVSSSDIISNLKLNEYQSSSEQIENFILNKADDESDEMELSISLKELSVNEDKIWEASYYFSLLLCSSVFDTEKIPLKMFSYGRDYQDKSFNEVVGYFTDFIPVLASYKELDFTHNVKQVQNTFEFVKNHNLNFVNLKLSAPDGGSFKEVVDCLTNKHLPNEDNMILFNFQGKRDAYNQTKDFFKIGKEQFNQYRLEGSSFSIISFYTEDQLCFSIVSKFKLDHDKVNFVFKEALNQLQSRNIL